MSLRKINIENLKPEELRTIFEMSRVILRSVDSASALKEITKIARPVFIFDNIILYQLREGDAIEPIYAKSVGRGRSAEADMAWGEEVAQEVLKAKELIIREENINPGPKGLGESRLDNRFFFGIPLFVESKINGILIFIRFGGPEYFPDQLIFGQLIAEQIEYLLEKQMLVNRIASLDAQRKLDKLQEEFVATVSHDLRSPLGFIKGYTTTLLRNDAVWDVNDRREFLTIIDEETDRLSSLIDNMLDSSRLQTGTLPMVFQLVNLQDFLSDFAQRIMLGDFPVDISLNLDKTEKKVWIDPARMIQVLDNLITNAQKYASKSPINISLHANPETVHIIIQDQGPGIPRNELKKIFKRFYRLPEHRDSVKGSGLGLFICEHIIKAHHGEIYADSIQGNGASFHIHLPRDWVPECER